MVFFVVWGLWVNWEYGGAVRVQVAVTQGLVSFLSTLFSAEWIVCLGSMLRERKYPVLWTGATSWLSFYAVILLVHLIAGTPKLLATMLPGMISGLFFSFGYAIRVNRFWKNDAHPAD